MAKFFFFFALLTFPAFSAGRVFTNQPYSPVEASVRVSVSLFDLTVPEFLRELTAPDLPFFTSGYTVFLPANSRRLSFRFSGVLSDFYPALFSSLRRAGLCVSTSFSGHVSISGCPYSPAPQRSIRNTLAPISPKILPPSGL